MRTKYSLVILSSIVTLCVMIFISCTSNLSENQKIIIREYTQQEHDNKILGKWQDTETFYHEGRDSYICIYLDSCGVKQEKMYVENQAHNDWHFFSYYYTNNDTLYSYIPFTKSIISINTDEDVFKKYKYYISKDTLYLGEKRYKKI